MILLLPCAHSLDLQKDVFQFLRIFAIFVWLWKKHFKGFSIFAWNFLHDFQFFTLWRIFKFLWFLIVACFLKFLHDYWNFHMIIEIFARFFLISIFCGFSNILGDFVFLCFSIFVWFLARLLVFWRIVIRFNAVFFSLVQSSSFFGLLTLRQYCSVFFSIFSLLQSFSVFFGLLQHFQYFDYFPVFFCFLWPSLVFFSFFSLLQPSSVFFSLL